MTLSIAPSGQSCGATVSGVDLTGELDPAQVADIRAAWLQHRVLSFPDQAMTDSDLERFTQYFGPFGTDPYFESIDGHPNIAAVARSADETAPIFADAWHADWSFQEFPPDGTCLFAKIVPPESAYATQLHPLIRPHGETGEDTLYSTIGYIIGIDGMDQEQAMDLLKRVYAWQTQEQFVYTHTWEANMLVMWDNRCVLHKATGGYDGHERLLHRTTIGYDEAVRA